MSKKNKRQAPRQFSSPMAKTTEFKPDYSIIKHDLKRIGILAGTFFAILIVLAIFQNQLLAIFLK
jgi:hypothetical protein